ERARRHASVRGRPGWIKGGLCIRHICNGASGRGPGPGPEARPMATRRGGDGLDTYLLRVFGILMAERSVSRAALKLNQSQPAVSVALRNLRAIFNDPLLVREKSGMVPTERALALLEHARAALGEIDAMLAPEEAFRPDTSQQVFRIGSPDYLAPAFAAGVVNRFRREAPNARLVLHS